MKKFKTLEVGLPKNIEDKELWRKAIKFQFIYSIIGLVLGLICVLEGVILFLHGIVGPTASWTTSLLGLNVSDAAPGVILFLVGLLFVWITRFSVTTDQESE